MTSSSATRSSSRAGTSRSRRQRRSANPGLSLSVTSAGEPVKARRGPDLPWLPTALGGGAVVAMLGWLLCSGVAVVGWLGASAADSGAAMRMGAQLWFLAHGAGARLPGAVITLVPLALPLTLLLSLRLVARYATGQLLRSDDVPVDLMRLDRGRLVRRVTSMVVLGYGGVMLIVAVLAGSGTQITQAVLGAGVIAVLGAGWGTLGAARVFTPGRWTGPLLTAWRSALSGTLTLVISAAVVTGLALLQHSEDIAALAAASDLGVLGGLVMVVLQLLYLPNVVVWTGSYLLGAGFTLGDGSLVSPVVTQLGLLPALPITAATPRAGIHGDGALLWLSAGVLAGVVAAAVLLRGRGPARLDQTTVLGGFGGVLGGLGFVGLAALSRGSLGTGRLVDLGPRMLALLVMAVTVLGLAGMVTGLIWGLCQRPAWLARSAEDDAAEHEPTQVIRPTRAPRSRPQAEWAEPDRSESDGESTRVVLVGDPARPDQATDNDATDHDATDHEASDNDATDDEAAEPTRRVPRLTRDPGSPRD